MDSLTRDSTYPLTALVAPTAPRVGSGFEQPGAWLAMNARPVPSLFLIRLWLLAAFIGTSMLVSAFARVFGVGVGAGAGEALRIVAGATLVWIASRRLARIAQEVDRIGSEASEPQ